MGPIKISKIWYFGYHSSERASSAGGAAAGAAGLAREWLESGSGSSSNESESGDGEGNGARGGVD
jgi:hypothetical protein